jgi:hypothetical protein
MKSINNIKVWISLHFVKVLTQIMKTYVTAGNNSPLSNEHLLIVLRVRRILSRGEFFTRVTQLLSAVVMRFSPTMGARSERSRSFVFAARQHFHSLDAAAAGPLVCVSYFHVHAVCYDSGGFIRAERQFTETRAYIKVNSHLCVMCVIECNLWLSKDEPRLRGMPHLHNNEMGDL